MTGWEEEPLGEATDAEAPSDAPAPAPAFPNVVAFVRGYISPVTEARLGGAVTWCSEWWRHPGAVLRLEALWRAWEVLRLQPAGLSVWWTNHYDPHMRYLLDADRGPFSSCTKGHRAGRPLDAPAPPANWRDAPST